MSILGLSSSENLPKFTLISDRSIDEVPRISIAFPDGSTDTMILNKYYSNADDRRVGFNKCNFIGHLEKETGACIGELSSTKSNTTTNFLFALSL